MSTAAPLFEPSGYGPCGAVQMSSAVLFRFCRINIKLNIYRTCFIEENYITIIIVIISLVDPDKRSSSVVNTTAFFFREGFWRHGIFVSRRNVKERDTHVSRKSCII